jgi:hypothetical protein
MPLRGVLCFALALIPAQSAAHAFGARYDLPLPLPIWLWAAGATVALSFVVFALALRRGSGTVAYPRLDLPRLPGAQRLAHPLAIAAIRALSVAAFVALVACGFLGTQDPFRNIVPAFVWIGWWIGFTFLTVAVGDVWALVNPWRAVFPARFGLHRDLPPAIGAWPAVLLFLAFGWIEIVWEGNAVPSNLAALAVAYSLITWAGMLVFGRDAWLASGEVFTVYFGLLARLAPIDRGLKLRPPAAGLLDPRPASTSVAAFVIVMLATVTFDGLRETPLWASLMAPLARPGEPVGDAAWAAAATAGLLLTPCLFALVIWGACASMAWLARGDPQPPSAGELARLFVPTLLPIAFAYHVAHYLSYLLVAGQVVIPLASDPMGRGWDLFGTARYKPAIDLVGARFAWYTSVVVIVLGHVAAMYVAHRLALARFREPRTARASQYPFAALMVLYTMTSLWILAQPIVETRP